MEVGQKTAAVAAITSAVASAGLSDASMFLFGVQMSVVLAAFAGAMISLTFLPEQKFFRAIMTVASGTLAGAYLAGVVLRLSKVFIPGVDLPQDLDKPAAFLIGLGFQIAVPVFFDWIRRRKEGQ